MHYKCTPREMEANKYSHECTIAGNSNIAFCEYFALPQFLYLVQEKYPFYRVFSRSKLLQSNQFRFDYLPQVTIVTDEI